MKRFKSILAVLTEDSLHEVALTRAIHLARVNGAALTVVDVIDGAPGDMGRFLAAIPGLRGAEIEEDVIAYHRDRLRGLAERARAEGLEVTEAILQGSTFVEVIRMVLREGHDIVIKGATRAAHGRGVLKGVDMHLLRKCPCPVWMLMRDEHHTHSRILATVELDPQGETHRAGLDRLVMDLATSLADRDGARVSVVHAWQLQAEHALRHGRQMARYADEVDRMVARERDAASERLDTLLNDYPQVGRSDVHLLKGLPGDVIPEYAEAHQADLIVMGTVGRTGLSGFIMGNTAETILRQVSGSVIAVKPDGFVSPVTLNAG